MSRPDEELALHKDLLVARSSLCRLKIRHEVGVLRGSLSWHHAAMDVASSSPARTAIFLLALGGMGRERMARLLAFASRALMVARLTGVVMSLLRSGAAAPPDR